MKTTNPSVFRNKSHHNGTLLFRKGDAVPTTQHNDGGESGVTAEEEAVEAALVDGIIPWIMWPHSRVSEPFCAVKLQTTPNGMTSPSSSSSAVVSLRCGGGGDKIRAQDTDVGYLSTTPMLPGCGC